MKSPAIDVVVDANALVTYARLDGLALAELVADFEANGQRAGIPVSSFLAAFLETRPEERHHLIDLATDPTRATVLLPLRAGDALRVADLLALHAQDVAHCIVEARSRQVQLATYDADKICKSLDDSLILELIEP